LPEFEKRISGREMDVAIGGILVVMEMFHILTILMLIPVVVLFYGFARYYHWEKMVK